MGVRVNYIATTPSTSFYIAVFDSLTGHDVQERKKDQLLAHTQSTLRTCGPCMPFNFYGYKGI